MLFLFLISYTKQNQGKKKCIMQLISLVEPTTTIAAICRPSYWFFRCYFDGPI